MFRWMKKVLSNLWWAYKQWNRRQECIADHRHSVVFSEVPAHRVGTAVALAWCPHCLTLESVD